MQGYQREGNMLEDHSGNQSWLLAFMATAVAGTAVALLLSL
jgi:hypothetical protein